MKTFVPSSKTPSEKAWFLCDVENQVLGRVASKIAMILKGKHKPTVTPHSDEGDYVVVINAAKIAVTGKKMDDKMYYKHTGYPGGLKERNMRKVLEGARPCDVLKKAIKGMLPKGPLGAAMLKKLKLYEGSTHGHEAQQPKVLNLETFYEDVN